VGGEAAGKRHENRAYTVFTCKAIAGVRDSKRPVGQTDEPEDGSRPIKRKDQKDLRYIKDAPIRRAFYCPFCP
jgi:hypothetical protein